MKTFAIQVLSWLAVPGRHTTLHAGVITLIATAVFMMCTAGEMGAMGPLIIALSFYLVFAAAMIEFVFVVLFLIRRFAWAALRRYS